MPITLSTDFQANWPAWRERAKGEPGRRSVSSDSTRMRSNAELGSAASQSTFQHRPSSTAGVSAGSRIPTATCLLSGCFLPADIHLDGVIAARAARIAGRVLLVL